MQYEGDVYRLPSEARSLTIQVTVRCSHSKCILCHVYTNKQFRVWKRKEILTDLSKCRDTYGPYVQRVFFADGNVLVVKTELLLELLHYMKKNFPYTERIASYGTAKGVLWESEEGLVALRKVGLAVTYLGAESGDDEVLVHIQEGETAEKVIAAGQKLKRYGVQALVTSISGPGGSAGMEAHTVKFAEFINAMNPEHASILALHLSPGSPIAKEMQWGEMELLGPDQIMDETELSLTHIDSPGTAFRTNYASNYLALAGIFNQDLPRLLHEVREAREHSRYHVESWHRRLWASARRTETCFFLYRSSFERVQFQENAIEFAYFVYVRIFAATIGVSAGIEAHASIPSLHFSPRSPMVREVQWGETECLKPN